MSPKKLFIILVVLIILTLGLVGVLFLFPTAPLPGAPEPPKSAEPPGAVQKPSLKAKPAQPQAASPQKIKEFDDSIFETNKTQAETKEDALRGELQLFARNFLENYGSYSSESGYNHLYALYDKMTDGFKEFTEAWLAQNPAKAKSPLFYSIQTTVSQTEVQKFDAPSSATIRVSAHRSETNAPEYYNKQFNQTARVELKKVQGSFKVDGVYWDE